jgi:L-lactate utilization protein LutC
MKDMEALKETLCALHDSPQMRTQMRYQRFIEPALLKLDLPESLRNGMEAAFREQVHSSFEKELMRQLESKIASKIAWLNQRWEDSKVNRDTRKMHAEMAATGKSLADKVARQACVAAATAQASNEEACAQVARARATMWQQEALCRIAVEARDQKQKEIERFISSNIFSFCKFAHDDLSELDSQS